MRMNRCTVGKLAKLANIHPHTVRKYADKGLLKVNRDLNGWRIFPDPEGACKTIRQLLLGEIDEQTARDDRQ